VIGPGSFLKPGDVFTDDIEFKIYGVSGQNGLNVGMFEGIRDDGHVEFRSFGIEEGKTDAIEADGAFFDDQGAEFFGEFEAELPGAVCVVTVDADGGGIDVPLDDMPIEAAIHDHATFEIDEAAGLPVPEVCFFQGFIYGGNAVEVVADGFNGQAGAVVGYALVDL